MNDSIDFVLKSDDRSAAVETVQPRRVRTQLASHRAALLGLQDDAESLLSHISSTEGRAIWRRLYNGLGGADNAVQRIVDAVERGG